MKQSLLNIWKNISRLGLYPNEGIWDNRDVILLNRIVSVYILVLFAFLPVEVILNGSEFIPIILILILSLFVILALNKKRKFNFARHFSFIYGNLFILILGSIVGSTVGNIIFLIPLSLFGVILFKTKLEKISSLFVVAATVFTLLYIQKNYPPLHYIKNDIARVFSIIFYFMAMFMNFILGYYFVGLNHEYEHIIIEQKNNLHHKNKEVTESINYAQRIQNSILPPIEEIKLHLPDLFIYYKPKDIVAGDFYWFEEKNDLIIIAVADCTGHGVPGAMVSMICNLALNKAVTEFNITEPGKILDFTKEFVVHTFEKSKVEVKDGMDISLLSLNKKTREIKWSGANNPLWYISNNELTEIKATKQAVGKTENTNPFATHTLIANPNTSFYLFTDGYADQFGGPNGKKYMYKPLKNKLLEIHQLSMLDQQKIIDHEFENWKGNIEQVDDVCVLGFRI